MKKALLFLVALTSMLTAWAGTTAAYTYLTFELTDGSKASVEVAGLTLAFSGNTLTAGGQEFTLENLTKMYFSASDESTSGITAITAADLDEAIAIYDLSGRKVTRDEMRHGVFIVKTSKGSYKITKK